MMGIEKAAVLGAGTMGAQIAAHLANARVPTLLLDIVPGELSAEERNKGLTLEAKEVRNRITRAGLEAAKKARPAAFFTPELASLVSIGNFDERRQFWREERRGPGLLSGFQSGARDAVADLFCFQSQAFVSFFR